MREGTPKKELTAEAQRSQRREVARFEELRSSALFNPVFPLLIFLCDSAVNLLEPL